MSYTTLLCVHLFVMNTRWLSELKSIYRPATRHFITVVSTFNFSIFSISGLNVNKTTYVCGMLFLKILKGTEQNAWTSLYIKHCRKSVLHADKAKFYTLLPKTWCKCSVVFPRDNNCNSGLHSHLFTYVFLRVEEKKKFTSMCYFDSK